MGSRYATHYSRLLRKRPGNGLYGIVLTNQLTEPAIFKRYFSKYDGETATVKDAATI